MPVREFVDQANAGRKTNGNVDSSTIPQADILNRWKETSGSIHLPSLRGVLIYVYELSYLHVCLCTMCVYAPRVSQVT